MTTHVMKLHIDHYDAVRNGIKTFEIRKDDRDFKVGDTLRLREYDPIRFSEERDRFTSRATEVMVTYILRHEDFPEGIKEGYCVLGIRKIQNKGEME